MLVRGEDGAGEVAERLAAELRAAGVRAQLDAATEQSFGRRVTDWELRGVPVRIEVGPRDLAQGMVTVVRRDDGVEVGRSPSTAVVAARARRCSRPIQDDLLAAATQAREARTADVATVDEAGEAAADRVRPGAVADAGGRRRRGPPAGARRHRAVPPAARRHPAGERGRARHARRGRPLVLTARGPHWARGNAGDGVGSGPDPAGVR